MLWKASERKPGPVQLIKILVKYMKAYATTDEVIPSGCECTMWGGWCFEFGDNGLDRANLLLETTERRTKNSSHKTYFALINNCNCPYTCTRLSWLGLLYTIL